MTPIAPELLAEALQIRARARLVVAAADVETAIARMAARIAAELASRCPVVLAVLNGGAFAATALCRHFDFPYELDCVRLASYGRKLAGGPLEWHVRPRAELAGRAVLVVDDVLDRGTTLAALLAELAALGAGPTWSAVLVVKELEHPVERPRVDFVGLTVADAYLFGCGMDYKGFWRGLPDLYAAP